MTTLTFKGSEIQTNGSFPEIGDTAPEFTLVNTDLSEVSLSNFAGKHVVLNIFPSVDTSVCALQLKTFNSKVSGLDNTVLLFASLDLPFALKRFCAAEGVENAVTASDFRHQSISENYGVEMIDGPLAGLYARAVLVLDESHNVTYSELVAEVTEEPNYDAALEVLNVKAAA